MQLRFVTLCHVTFTLCCFTLCSNIADIDWPNFMNAYAFVVDCCTISDALLKFEDYIRFSGVWQTCAELMILLGAKGGGGGAAWDSYTV